MYLKYTLYTLHCELYTNTLKAHKCMHLKYTHELASFNIFANVNCTHIYTHTYLVYIFVCTYNTHELASFNLCDNLYCTLTVHI